MSLTSDFEEGTEEEKEEDFDIQGPDDFLNSVSIIDIFAEASLQWLKKLESSEYLVDTFEDFRVIRRRAKALKTRMRIASREALGNHTDCETRSRYAMLLKTTRRALKRMRRLKQGPSPSSSAGEAEETSNPTPSLSVGTE